MLGRYALYGVIARGGMAAVHFGRLLGPVGFSRTVAIKRLHPQLAGDQEFTTMFVDEARLAARIQHPNVVSTLDVVALEGELMLVMEYVQGESLSRLLHTLRMASVRVPMRIAGAIISDILSGLHAAHEAKNERGEPLGIVHRDMSPQNVIVGADGTTRVFDFGIAKAAGRAQDTRAGLFKGKLAYAAPEQLAGGTIDRRTDVYAAAIVLWEMICGRRMFHVDSEHELYRLVREGIFDRPMVHASDISPELDAIIMRGLARNPDDRWADAHEMALALEAVLPHANAREVSQWVHKVAPEPLKKRARLLHEVETASVLVPIGDSGVRELTPSSLPTNPASTFSIPPSTNPPYAPVSEAPPRKSRSPLIIALLLAVIAGLVIFLVIARGRDESASNATPANQGEKSGTKKKEKTKEPTVATTEPAATASIAAPTPTSSVTAHAPKATPATIVMKPVAPKPSASAPAAPPAAPVANCSPPFTIDADGIRHPKPECM